MFDLPSGLTVLQIRQRKAAQVARHALLLYSYCNPRTVCGELSHHGNRNDNRQGAARTAARQKRPDA
jgi:hypothetical protein